MPTSPDRTQIEQIMEDADVSGIADMDLRNNVRRAAVVAFLEDDNTYNLDQTGPQGIALRDMILDDLASYPQWEKLDEHE